MKKTIYAFLLLACAQACAITDTYRLTMRLRVPQVENNFTSQGTRKYRTQTLKGYLKVTYYDNRSPDVSITALTNMSFKASGKKVDYEVSTESSAWNLIGSNKTGKFSKASVFASFDAQPSYVSTYTPTSDNSLIISIAGSGKRGSRMTGFVTGTLGCGCSDYGHVSPTRIMGAFGPLDIVQDVASVYGQWKAVFKERTCD